MCKNPQRDHMRCDRDVRSHHHLRAAVVVRAVVGAVAVIFAAVGLPAIFCLCRRSAAGATSVAPAPEARLGKLHGVVLREAEAVPASYMYT